MRLDATRPALVDFVEQPTHHDYAKAARWALKEKQLPLAVQQVAAAIALAPLETAYHRLLDAIVDKARGPLRLVAMPSEGAFYGLCATRGRILARLGRYDEATEHVLAASAFSPSSPFVVWMRAWLAPPKQARQVSARGLAASVMALVEAVDASAPLDEGTRANLAAALDCCRFVNESHRVKKGAPREATLTVVMARVLRLLGSARDALAMLVDEEAELGDSWELAIARAAVLLELGDNPRRVEALERACELRADEASTFFDLGDARLAAGDPERAAAAYQAGLQRDSASTWGRIHHAYALALVQPHQERPPRPDEDCGPELRTRAELLATDLVVYREVFGHLIDPIIGVLRSIEARAESHDPSVALRVRVRAERPLAPSARLAFQLVLGAHGIHGELAVEHDAASPRLGPLWQNHDASPASSTPAPAVLDIVAQLAALPFAWTTWREHAREGAGPSDSAIPSQASASDFIAAMAHVPTPPRETDAVQWVHRWQVAAALLAAEAADPLATRQQLLGALVDGLDDWSAAAGLLGLSALAEAHPNLTPAVVDRLARILPMLGEGLPPCAWALAVVGVRLATGELRRSFASLRARVLSALAKQGSAHRAPASLHRVAAHLDAPAEPF